MTYMSVRHEKSHLNETRMRKLRAAKVQKAPSDDVRPPDLENLPAGGSLEERPPPPSP